MFVNMYMRVKTNVNDGCIEVSWLCIDLSQETT